MPGEVCVLCTKKYVYIFPAKMGEFHAGMVFFPTKMRSLDGPVKLVKEILEQEYSDLDDFHKKMQGLFTEQKRKYVFELAAAKKFKVFGFINAGLQITDTDDSNYIIGVRGKGSKAKLKGFFGK